MWVPPVPSDHSLQTPHRNHQNVPPTLSPDMSPIFLFLATLTVPALIQVFLLDPSWIPYCSSPISQFPSSSTPLEESSTIIHSSTINRNSSSRSDLGCARQPSLPPHYHPPSQSLPILDDHSYVPIPGYVKPWPPVRLGNMPLFLDWILKEWGGVNSMRMFSQKCPLEWIILPQPLPRWTESIYFCTHDHWTPSSLRAKTTSCTSLSSKRQHSVQ